MDLETVKNIRNNPSYKELVEKLQLNIPSQ